MYDFRSAPRVQHKAQSERSSKIQNVIAVQGTKRNVQATKGTAVPKVQQDAKDVIFVVAAARTKYIQYARNVVAAWPV